MIKKNQELTLTILELNMLGYGVAKCDGAVFFVQDALPGETCLCRVIKCAKNYFVARVISRKNDSPHRVDPLCPCWRSCGGCSFRNASYELELLVKHQYVKNCLLKAGLDKIDVLPVLSAGKESRYRNKGQFPVAKLENGLISGFYANRTHRVIPIRDCIIQNSAFSAIIPTVLDFCEKYGVAPYCETDQSGLLRHIYLRIGEKTGEIMLCLVLKEDCFPREEDFCRLILQKHSSVTSIVFNFNPDDTNVILGKKERIVYGKETISDILCGKTFSLSPHSFYQVNRDGAELLYQTALNLAGITPDTAILDLYCGVGTIGQCMAEQGQKILGVEIVPEAVRNARQNAIRNGFISAEYYCGDAALLFDKLSAKESKDALLVLDPPRKGVSESLIHKIAGTNLNRILYISCNPQTLANDLALFYENGYSFDTIQPVDLFPRTSHVETVTLITRVC